MTRSRSLRVSGTAHIIRRHSEMLCARIADISFSLTHSSLFFCPAVYCAVPTGIPLVYKLDKDLKVIVQDGAVPPLSGKFLVDEDELKKKQEEVANQSKLRYGIEEGK